MCKDLKRCEHRHIMSPSTSSTVPTAEALRKFNLVLGERIRVHEFLSQKTFINFSRKISKFGSFHSDMGLPRF